MIDHDAYDAAEGQREAQLRHDRETAQDAEHLNRLVWLFDTQGAAFVSANFERVVHSYPPGFVQRHVRVVGGGTAYQRVSLRSLDLDEAA